MIASVIDAISVALYEEFGYEIHSEKVEQGLIKPCFFITCINHSIRPFFGKKYFCNNQFCIQYFPGTAESNRECYLTAERMMWCLELIRADGSLMRGTGIKYQMEEGILNFTINYDFYTYRRNDEEIKMEATETIQEVKG